MNPRAALLVSWFVCSAPFLVGCDTDFERYRFDRQHPFEASPGGEESPAAVEPFEDASLSNEQPSPADESEPPMNKGARADAAGVCPAASGPRRQPCQAAADPLDASADEPLTDAHEQVPIVQVEAVYGQARELNHYVAADGSTLWDASGASCDVHDSTAVDDCIHAGVLRQVTVATRAQCASLQLREDLNAFEWSCEPAGDRHVVFRTRRLRAGAALAELVDFRSAAFRDNAVQVLHTGDKPARVIARSRPEAWWSDAVVALAPSSLPSLRLDRPHTLYLVSEEMADDTPVSGVVLPRLDIVADGVSLVVEPLTWLRSRIPGAPAIATDTEDTVSFIWLEARVDLDGRAEAALDLSLRQSLLRKLELFEGGAAAGNAPPSKVALRLQGSANRMELVSVTAESATGLLLQGRNHRGEELRIETGALDAIDSTAPGTRLSAVRAHGGGVRLQSTAQVLQDARIDSGELGVWLGGEGGHLLYDVHVANTVWGLRVMSDNNSVIRARISNTGTGLQVGFPDDELRFNNRIVDVRVSNAGGAIGVGAGRSTLLLKNTAQASYYGLLVEKGASSDNRIAHSLALANVGNLLLDAEKTHVRDVALSSSISNGVDILMDGSHNVFSGVLKLSATPSCAIGPQAVEPGLTVDPQAGNCIVQGGSTAEVRHELDLLNHVAGRMDTPDARNESAMDRSYPLPLNMITDWFEFETPYRVWGPASPDPFPAPSTLGPCRSSTYGCTVYDWSLDESADILVASRPSDPRWVQTHAWHAADAAACGAIPGAVWQDDSCVSTFLQCAVESMRSDRGNHNGLCESGEWCLVQLELGAQLETRGPVTVTQPQTIGAVENVTLYSYDHPDWESRAR